MINRSDYEFTIDAILNDMFNPNMTFSLQPSDYSDYRPTYGAQYCLPENAAKFYFYQVFIEELYDKLWSEMPEDTTLLSESESEWLEYKLDEFYEVYSWIVVSKEIIIMQNLSAKRVSFTSDSYFPIFENNLFSVVKKTDPFKKPISLIEKHIKEERGEIESFQVFTKDYVLNCDPAEKDQTIH